jgi:hypothetical protein
MFILPQTGTTTIKLLKTSKQLLQTLSFTVEQPLIHETAGLFPVKIGKKTFCAFVNFLQNLKQKIVLSKWKTVI